MQVLPCRCRPPGLLSPEQKNNYQGFYHVFLFFSTTHSEDGKWQWEREIFSVCVFQEELNPPPTHPELPNPVFFCCYDGNVVTISNPGRTVPQRTIGRIQRFISFQTHHLSQSGVETRSHVTIRKVLASLSSCGMRTEAGRFVSPWCLLKKVFYETINSTVQRSPNCLHRSCMP